MSVVLDAFALLVILVLCAGAIWLLVALGSIPGKIARASDHPQHEAINVLAWIGLFTGGIGWLVALVWAKTKPLNGEHKLARRVSALEARIEQLEGES